MTRPAIKVLAGFAIFYVLRAATIFGSHAYDAANAAPVQTETRATKIERLETDINVSKSMIKEEMLLGLVAAQAGNIDGFKEQRELVNQLNHIMRQQQQELQQLITDADFSRPNGRCYKAFVAKKKSALLASCYRYQDANAYRWVKDGAE